MSRSGPDVFHVNENPCLPKPIHSKQKTNSRLFNFLGNDNSNGVEFHPKSKYSA